MLNIWHRILKDNSQMQVNEYMYVLQTARRYLMPSCKHGGSVRNEIPLELDVLLVDNVRNLFISSTPYPSTLPRELTN